MKTFKNWTLTLTIRRHNKIYYKIKSPKNYVKITLSCTTYIQVKWYEKFPCPFRISSVWTAHFYNSLVYPFCDVFVRLESIQNVFRFGNIPNCRLLLEVCWFRPISSFGLWAIFYLWKSPKVSSSRFSDPTYRRRLGCWRSTSLYRQTGGCDCGISWKK